MEGRRCPGCGADHGRTVRAEDPVFALYRSPRGAAAGWRPALEPLDPLAAGLEDRHRRDAR